MSLAGPQSTNIHQIGQTLAWWILLDISAVGINLRHRAASITLHAILGWVILVLTYGDILIFLVPYGYNATLANGSVALVIHGIAGLCLMAFVVLQVAGGVLIKLQLGKKEANLALLAKLKKGHRFFGYFLSLVYKVNIFIAWLPTWALLGPLLIWEIIFVYIVVRYKYKRQRLEGVVVDKQVATSTIQKVQSAKEIEAITHSYVIFQNYAYHTHEVVKTHPGGNRVIQTVIGREVDRFLYGMYSSELLPELAAFSHSEDCLRLAGPPFAQLMVTPTYDGFTTEVMKARISFVHPISEKTQIYELGLSVEGNRLSFRGYSQLQQLGQYYSLTINNRTTRLYTAVNFLTLSNVGLMISLIPDLQYLDLYKNGLHPLGKMRETQLQLMKKGSELNEGLLEKKEKNEKSSTFLPIMLKIYKDGKMTSQLKKNQFRDEDIKVSCPRGRGLELDCTPTGKIIVLAGGTGLFPFCDIIDLLFKAHWLAEGHPERGVILRENPILQTHSFSQNSFLFLIAINEPDDIHPITMHQLVHLSNHSKTVKVVLRVSKSADKLSSLKSKIEFTKDYFNKRVVSEAASENLARVWICGPPKLSSDTAAALLQSGLKRESFLLL